MIINEINMEKLVVLDYCDGSVNIYNIKESNNQDTEELLKSLGHRLDDCCIMWTNNLTIHIES